MVLDSYFAKQAYFELSTIHDEILIEIENSKDAPQRCENMFFLLPDARHILGDPYSTPAGVGIPFSAHLSHPPPDGLFLSD